MAPATTPRRPHGTAAFLIATAAGLLALARLAPAGPRGGAGAGGGCDELVRVGFPASRHLLRTAEAGLGAQAAELERMRTLAALAADASRSAAERAVLDSEFQFRLGKVDRLSVLTSFRGVRLLDGGPDACLEGRPPLRVRTAHDLPDTRVSSLGLADATVVTAERALVALALAEDALATVAAARAEQALARSRLTH